MILLEKIIDRLLSHYFKVTSRKPWAFGYSSYKRAQIEAYIRKGLFDPQGLPANYGVRLDERIIEIPWLYSRLSDKSEIFLDAGSALNFGYLISLPHLAAKRIFISTLAPERRQYVKRSVSYVFEDLRYSSFRDGFFDTIASISTIEHIGLDNTFLYTSDLSKKETRPRDFLIAVAEYMRMLKPGGTLYISVPFGKQMVCGWYQVFNLDQIEEMIQNAAPADYQVSFYQYYPDGWQISSALTCAKCETFDIHKQKTYRPDFLAFSQAVCCLEMVKPT